jgi:hypothetical protein
VVARSPAIDTAWARLHLFRSADSKENDMKNCNTRAKGSWAVRLGACVTALGMAVTFAPQAVDAQTVTPPVVPADIAVLPPHQAFLLGRGVGTQNYVCQPAASLGRVAWTLFTPQATLFSDDNEQLTTHFFSPNPVEGGIVRVTWEDSADTSTVWARLVASVSVNPDAIAWLRLEVVGARVGPTGGGALVGTTFIQRVNTVGGLAPATGCDALPDVGRKIFVPYTADYFFYRKN